VNVKDANRTKILVQPSQSLSRERVFKLFPFTKDVEFHSLDDACCRPAINQDQIALETDNETLDTWKGGGKSFGHHLGGFSKSTLLISG
jgi:hypothetical protein